MDNIKRGFSLQSGMFTENKHFDVTSSCLF